MSHSQSTLGPAVRKQFSSILQQNFRTFLVNVSKSVIQFVLWMYCVYLCVYTFAWYVLTSVLQAHWLSPIKIRTSSLKNNGDWYKKRTCKKKKTTFLPNQGLCYSVTSAGDWCRMSNYIWQSGEALQNFLVQRFPFNRTCKMAN